MYKNFIKTAWRSLKHNKTYSYTNLFGLSLGLFVIMLLMTRILDEISYDKHWKNNTEIFKIHTQLIINEDRKMDLQVAPKGIAEAWTEDFPDIVQATNLDPINQRFMVDSIDNFHAELNLLETDTSFFSIFDYEIIKGNYKQVSPHGNNLILTESTYQKYFSNQEVIGKEIWNVPQTGTPTAYTIQAVIKDIPANSHFSGDAFLISAKNSNLPEVSFDRNSTQYVLLKKNTDTATLASKLNNWYTLKTSNSKESKRIFSLESIRDIHLDSTQKMGWENRTRYLYLYGLISFLLLFLITINFINLTFVHILKKTVESGVRKVLGAHSKHFYFHVGAESLLLFAISFFIAFLAYLIAFPYFENYMGNTIVMKFHSHPIQLLILFLIWVSIGLFCSIFPALSLAQNKPNLSLKKHLNVMSLPMNKKFTLGMIGIQFCIAIIVIISMLTMYAQLKFMDNKDLGYEPKNLLVIEDMHIGNRNEAFKQSLLRNPSIESASFSHWTPFYGWADFSQIENPHNPNQIDPVAILTTDFDFAKTLKLELIEGRNLDPAYALDAVNYTPETIENNIKANVLINEFAYEMYDLKINETDTRINKTPIGKFRNFHPASLKLPIIAVVIEAQNELITGAALMIRAVEGQETSALHAFHTTWKEFSTHAVPPSYHWVDQKVQDQYEEERKQLQQLAFFGLISLLIALLGILGIIIYTVERRIKEIGIRRVLGASTESVLTLFSKSFIKPILVAIIVAFPIAYYVMQKWLENFHYRIDVPLELFILTGIFTLLSMLLVVFWQVWNALQMNPVDSLRDE